MANKWIQKADMEKGAFSRALKIPEKKNIPMTLIKKIIDAEPGDTITNPTKTGKKKIKVTRELEIQAIAAKALKSMAKKKKK